MREPAFLAQASLAHLGEISRDVYPSAIRELLAQAKRIGFERHRFSLRRVRVA